MYTEVWKEVCLHIWNIRLIAYFHFLFYVWFCISWKPLRKFSKNNFLRRYIKTAEINWPLRKNRVFKLLIKLGAFFIRHPVLCLNCSGDLTMPIIKNVFCSLQHHLPLRLQFCPRLDARQHMHFSFVYYPRVVLFPNIDIIYFYQH